MKKITKVLMAAVAVSTLCFAGCKMPGEVIGGEIFDGWSTEKNDETGAEITATIDYTNEDPEYVERDILLFKNKKKDIAVNVIMDDAKNVPGFMSVVFNQTKNKDGTYNFIALGFNSNYTGNKAKIACTYYKNVKKDDLKAKNFGKTDTDKSSLDDDIQELMPSADKDGFVVANNIAPDIDGKLKVGFVITANRGSDPYTVRIYGNKTAKQLNAIADAIGSQTTDDDDVIGTPEKEFNITAAELGLERTAESGKIDAGIGFYVNVYEGKTLKGEWQVGDISHNPNGIIWEDEIPSTLNIQLAE